MKIAIMMRAMDQDSGFRVYTERLVETMLQIDNDNSYLLLYRKNKWFGRFSSYKNAKEVLVHAPPKLVWDQIAVPYKAWRERADVIFNPKFSVPLISHCKVTMGLQEPAWWKWPDHHEWWDVLYMRTMLPLYCRKSAYIFPMSQFILDENRKYLRLPLENTAVAYSAPNVHFQPMEDSVALDKFRQNYQLPSRFILSVTRVEHAGNENPTFCPTKNVETTLRAYALCREQIPHELVIAGRSVREYLLHTGWNSTDFKGVHFLGFVPHEEMAKLYSMADLFLIPSFYEGFGHTLLEAMTCGCPTIASEAGACPEIAAGAALLANPNDPENIAKKIIQVLRNDVLRQQLKSKSLKRAAFFNWERTARIVLDGLSRVSEKST